MTLEEATRTIQKCTEIINGANDALSSYIAVKCPKKPVVKLVWDDLNQFNGNNSDESDEVKGEYIITLYAYAFFSFEEHLKNNHCPPEAIEIILSYVVSYVYFHEYFHILFGHCSIPKPERYKIDTLTKRRMEYACDMKAIDTMFEEAEVIYTHTGDLNSYEQRYGTFLASLFLYFKFYEDKELQKMKKNEGTDKYRSCSDDRRTHPFLTFRFEYLRSLIDRHIDNCCTERGENSKDILTDIYSITYDLLRKYGNKGHLKVNPWKYENAAEIDRIGEIDFDKINSLCSEIFIDDLK